MIRRVVVSNFRSLGEGIVFRPGRLTALVGPNESGKSNLADVFPFVADALRAGLDEAIADRKGIQAVRRWGAGRVLDVGIHLDVEDQRVTGSYEFVIGSRGSEGYWVKHEAARVTAAGAEVSYLVADGAWREGPPGLLPKVDRERLALPVVAADERFGPLEAALRSMVVYAIFPDTLREPQEPNPRRPLDEHGANWASVLRGLVGTPSASEFKAALGRLAGDIADVRVQEVGGYLVAEFLHVRGQGRPERQGVWFPAVQESDGTLRVAGILTALLQEPSLALVGVEEPELTVYPHAIPMLFDYLREASYRSQVLVTTHSPELLALLDPDDVWVVERREGVTSVGPVETSQREAVRRGVVSLEDVLRMEGLRQEGAEPESTPRW